MSDVIQGLRRTLTIGVVLTTILWSMMASALVAPLKASAAGCTSNTLIKGSLAAVYYCGSDGKRYVFANEKTYSTWYADFSSVMTISDADLASIQIGGNATYRPGVKMVKITTDPKVYAVAKGGVLRHVTSEAIAVALYGSTWNKMIDDVPDAFFTNYSIGSAINAAGDFDKTAEMSASQNINADKNLGGSSSSGVVNASLSASNPASMTVPGGAQGVNVLAFSLSNSSSSAATVDSLTVHRAGPGAPADFLAVYLYEGSTRLTTGRTVNTTTNDVSFTGLNLALSGGQTRNLWVGVDVKTTPAGGNVHAFSVSGASAGASTVGGLPVMGNNMTLAAQNVGSLEITKSGSLTKPKAGQLAAKIGEFQLAAGSAEDVNLQRVTLFQSGNLSGSNLTNLKLTQAGNTLATASTPDSKLRITFNLAAPLKIEKGQTRTFEVWADIGGSARSADTIRLYAEENTDVYAVGVTYGHGVTVTRTGASGYDGTGCTADNTGKCSATSLEAGQVTLTFNGPLPKNYPLPGRDVEIFNFTMAVQSNIEVKKVSIKLTAGASAAGASGLINTSTPNYTDVKIMDAATGQVWWGPLDLSGTGDAGAADLNQTLAFTDVQTMASGSSKTFKVTADVSSSVPSDETIKATIVAFGTSDLRSLDNSTFLTPSTDVVPAGDIAGFLQTAKLPYLGVGLNAIIVSNSFIKGARQVPSFSFSLQPETGTTVTLSSLTLTGFIDADGATDFVQGQDADGSGTVAVSDIVESCMLVDVASGMPKGEKKSPTSGTGGLFQFTNLNWTIPESGVSVLVYCDISNSAFKNGDNERYAIEITGSSSAVVQNHEGGTASFLGSFTVNGTPSTIVTVKNAGTMTYDVAPTDSESEAGLVVGGASNVTLAKLRLTAANEELKQTKLRIRLATAANYVNVTSMALYDGATLVGGPVPVNSAGQADFTGMNFVVPKDTSKTLTVKATLNTTSAGAVSGADLAVFADTDASSGPTFGNFEYRGTNSSTVVSTNENAVDADTAGNTKILRKTRPTLVNVALPTTLLADGEQVLAKFTVSADPAEQVSLKRLTFNVAKSAAAIDLDNATAKLRDTGTGSDVALTGSYDAGCAAAGASPCTIKIAMTSEEAVSAGSSKTYELRVTVAATPAGTQSLQTTLTTDTAQVTGELDGAAASPIVRVDDLDGAAAAAEYNFVWSDNSAVPHNSTGDTNADGADDAAASNDWTNGRFVKQLPNDVQTLSKT